MLEVRIKLNGIQDVKDFVNCVNLLDGEYDLSTGNYVVDAKSILGILSLDLSVPLRLSVYNTTDTLPKELEPFVVANNK